MEKQSKIWVLCLLMLVVFASCATPCGCWW